MCWGSESISFGGSSSDLEKIGLAILLLIPGRPGAKLDRRPGRAGELSASCEDASRLAADRPTDRRTPFNNFENALLARSNERTRSLSLLLSVRPSVPSLEGPTDC